MSDETTTSSQGMLAITPDRQKALLIASGAAAGVAQTVLLRKFVDGTTTSWMPTLPTWMPAGFTKPSTFIGVVGGLAGIIVGLYVPLDPKLKNIAVAYGGSSLVSGLLSGLDLIS
jgi:hypothetical protein